MRSKRSFKTLDLHTEGGTKKNEFQTNESRER